MSGSIECIIVISYYRSIVTLAVSCVVPHVIIAAY